jgi:hypothetical protein
MARNGAAPQSRPEDLTNFQAEAANSGQIVRGKEVSVIEVEGQKVAAGSE